MIKDVIIRYFYLKIFHITYIFAFINTRNVINLKHYLRIRLRAKEIYSPLDFLSRKLQSEHADQAPQQGIVFSHPQFKIDLTLL
jgi:hypothetical protein